VLAAAEWNAGAWCYRFGLLLLNDDRNRLFGVFIPVTVFVSGTCAFFTTSTGFSGLSIGAVYNG
jgi:hypothetical protein